MKFNIYQSPAEWERAIHLCVVIDVLRAFTTAAYAFSKGAENITFVGTAEEALCIREANQEIILMGEKNGLPIHGFHYGNSPTEIETAELSGKKIVQRTSAGTQGVIACRNAENILVSSFVIADATLSRIQEINPKEVSFIVTGQNNGDEDLALAEYMIERLQGKSPDIGPYIKRVGTSPYGLGFLNRDFPQFQESDLILATEANRFSFAIEVQKVHRHWVGYPVGPYFAC
ncbi:MAG: 2-phosphosulfolactate phosphatase [Waddliaceae bacterium]